MRITNLAIKNRTAVVVLTALLVIGGLLSYISIPKESSPQIEFAMIVVTTVYPGASPNDIESIITQKIEQEVAVITGIDEIRSTSTEGVSTVIIEFVPDKDVSEAAQEVREKVDLAKPEFPSDVEDPLVSEIDFSEFPIMSVNLLSSGSLSRLRDTAEDLQDILDNDPGVLEVDLIGGLEHEVQVNIDIARLQGYGLSIMDVVAAIQTENTNIPGGSIDLGPENYLVRIDGEFNDPAEIENLVVSSPGGRSVYVRDVGEVVFGFKDRASYARLELLQTEVEQGEFVPVDNPENLQVIRLDVKKRAGDNIIETVDRVHGILESFTFPAGTSYTVTGDQSEQVEILITDLENNIIAAIIFVVLVLLFFLGVRNAVLVGIAIPLSMFLSFLIFSMLGQTLNFIMLFSLIIALGMMVDNAVVILENIYRFREEGYSRWEAAKGAVEEVGMAVAASTATTVAVFIPMLFWPGIIGKFMGFLPMTLIVTLSASLFVALVINPVIAGFLIRLDSEIKKKERSTRQRRVIFGIVAFLALLIALANWKTLVFLAVTIPLLVLLYRRVLDPVYKRFSSETVPKMTARYRDFLDWMLVRDYSVKRALFRNTFALGAFTAGFILLILGGVVAGLIGFPAALLLLVPGGISLLVGIIGIVGHTLESAFLGRGATVKAGLIFLGIIVTLLTLLAISGKELHAPEVAAMILFPGVIILAGFLGKLFAGDRSYIVLTDNRARLLTGTLGALLGIFVLFGVAPTGVEFFPTTDPNLIQITAEAPLGTNLEESNRIASDIFSRVSNLLESDEPTRENTKDIQTGVGVGGDVMFGGGAAGPERSTITMNMVDFSAREEPSSETLRKVRDEIQGIPGIDLQIEQDQNGPPTGAPINIEISGEDFDQIVQISDEIKARLVDASATGAVPGLVDIRDNLNTGRPEFQVIIDRERAAQFGLSTQEVASTVRSAVNGIEASTWRDGKDEYDITVRLEEADRSNLESLQSLTILDEGNQIPLVSVAHVEVGSGLGSVTRLDQQRVVTVQGDVAPGVNAAAALQMVQAHLAEYVESVPPGYTISYTGESEDMDESF
ncbi:MAG: efflux RND transporter permease subunit, partial [Rubricoccaceae bacterium]|nr:efflux RND transporter permease subunit [Rubricoccaceae bacterium]